MKQNDLLRLDGKKDFINCSIQYPNFWYYNKIKDNNPIFEDWCILYIDPLVITYDTTEFCSVNAATAHGAYIESGYDAFADMYSNKICVNGKYDRFRPKNKLLNVPTDDQAEVLVYKNIPRKYITGIAFKNEEIAKNKITQWEVMNFPKFNVYIAPDLFCRAVSDKINGGDIPIEYPYEEGK